MPPQLPPIGGEVPADLWPMVYPPLPPIGGEVVAQPYARGTRIPEGDLPPAGTVRSATVPGSVQVTDPNAPTETALQVGGVPYVRGMFTPQELEAIGRSPAAQAVQPPSLTLPPPPAPEPAPMPIHQRGRFTGLPGRDFSSATPEPVTEGVIQAAHGLAHGSRYYTQPTTETLNAASDVLEGAMKIGTPLAVAGAIADLPGTVLALGASYVAGKTAKAGAHAAGASPEMERFLENLGAATTAVVSGREIAKGVGAGTSSTARALVLAARLSGRTIGEARPVGAGATVTEAAQVTKPGYHAPIEAIDSGTPSSVQSPGNLAATPETLADILAESPAVETLREQFPNLSAEELDALIRQYGGTAHQATFLERPGEAAAGVPVTPPPPGAPEVPTAPVAAQAPLPAVGEPVPEPLTPAEATSPETPPAAAGTALATRPSLALQLGTDPHVRAVDSLEHAAQMVDTLVDEHEQATGEGVSSFPKTTVIDTTTGKPVATISYNGRIWDATSGQEIARTDNRGYGKPAPIDVTAAEPETPPATTTAAGEPIGTGDARAALEAKQQADTAAPSAGMTRMYRGVPVGEEPAVEGRTHAYGRWFTSDLEQARRYAGEGGRVLYVDMPSAEMEEARLPGDAATVVALNADDATRARALAGVSGLSFGGKTHAEPPAAEPAAPLPAIGDEVPQPPAADLQVPQSQAPTPFVQPPAAPPRGYDEDTAQETFRKFKTALARAQYAAQRKNLTPEDRRARLEAVIAEADRFAAYYDASPEPYPDDWARWQRAKDDAQHALARLPAALPAIGQPMPTPQLPPAGGGTTYALPTFVTAGRTPAPLPTATPAPTVEEPPDEGQAPAVEGPVAGGPATGTRHAEQPAGGDRGEGAAGVAGEQPAPAAGVPQEPTQPPGARNRRPRQRRERPRGGAAVPGAGAEPGGGGVVDEARDVDTADVADTQEEADAHARGEAPRWFTITGATDLTEGGWTKKLDDNLAALRLLKQLDREGRPASAEEQAVLARYIGWGHTELAPIVDPRETTLRDPRKTQARQDLQQLLTKAEFKELGESTANAHYSFADLPRAMWQVVERLGFTGGSILEPAVGTGHFLGTMPGAIRTHKRTKIYGVDKEPIAAGIARQLYQGAYIQASPLEEAVLPANYFDLVISNVPFGRIGVFDPAFVSPEKTPLTRSIHNYYFAKALDLARPGGLLVFVTSRYTMDAQDDGVRSYLHRYADFVGAFRLPDEAFRKTAGTDVVTDVIVLQKREPEAAARKSTPAWTKSVERKELGQVYEEGKGQTYVHTNEYYVAHKAQVLGTENRTGKMNRAGNQYNVQGTVSPEQLAKAVASFPERIYKASKAAPRKVATAARQDTKQGSFVLEGGKLYTYDKGTLTQSPYKGLSLARAKAFVPLRDAYQAVIDAMLAQASDADLMQAQKALALAYRAFVNEHGHLNQRENKRIIDDDPNASRVLALENVDIIKGDKGKPARIVVTGLADIFTKRLMRPPAEPTTAGSAHDALLQSVAWRGRVDLPYMESLTGKPGAVLAGELAGEIFQDPVTQAWFARDEYLSGDVVSKLAQAEAAAKVNPAFAANVSALTSVQPTALTIDDFTGDPATARSAPFGATWVPVPLVTQFLTEHGSPQADVRLLNTKTKVTWYVEGWGRHEFLPSGNDYAKWVAEALNGEVPTIRVRNPDGSTSVDPEATERYRQSLGQLKEQWATWWKGDPDAAKQIVAIYNAMFNREVPRAFDGSRLVTPNSNPEIQLREGQKDSVMGALQRGNTLLAQAVGWGKTFELIAIAGEWKRLGFANKPLIVVPNHIVEQWRRDILRFYPAARVLLPEKRDFETGNRKRLIARIANNDWDAVVLGASQFLRIGVRLDTLKQFVQEQEDQLLAEGAAELMMSAEEFSALVDAYGKDDKKAKQAIAGRGVPRSVKDVARAILNLRKRLKKRTDQQFKDPINFEDLGVDGLMVDEAHMFKNLYFYTGKNDIVGLKGSDADQALDMFLKVRHINQASNNRNVVFATGTPVSNTMSELYTMFRYLAQPTLDRLGMSGFDSWANAYAQAVGTMEPAPEGGYKERTRLSEWSNLQELSRMFKRFADVVTTEDILKENKRLEAAGKPPLLKLPAVKKTIIELEPHPESADFMQSLRSRIEAVRKGDPGHTRTGALDGFLPINTDAALAAVDMRLVMRGAADDPNGRIRVASREIAKRYHASMATKGVQLVFLDVGVPHGKDIPPLPASLGGAPVVDEESDDEPTGETPGDLRDEEAEGEAALDGIRHEAFDANLYGELKRLLVEQGIKPDEVAFIHQATNASEQRRLYQAVREGQVRVLLSTRAKGGTGMNVQDRVIALHHLDVPWRPDQMEQAEGRAVRQGNQNETVEILRYVTKKSFDEYRWYLLAKKQGFIAGFYRGELGSMEDVDLTQLDMQVASALASGDPRVLQMIQGERALSGLRARYENFSRRRGQAERDKRAAEKDRAAYQKEIPQLRALATEAAAWKAAGRPVVIDTKPGPYYGVAPAPPKTFSLDDTEQRKALREALRPLLEMEHVTDTRVASAGPFRIYRDTVETERKSSVDARGNVTFTDGQYVGLLTVKMFVGEDPKILGSTPVWDAKNPPDLPRSLDHKLDVGWPGYLADRLESGVERTTREIDAATTILEKTFDQQAELAAKEKEVTDLRVALGVEKAVAAAPTPAASTDTEEEPAIIEEPANDDAAQFERDLQELRDERGTRRYMGVVPFRRGPGMTLKALRAAHATLASKVLLQQARKELVSQADRDELTILERRIEAANAAALKFHGPTAWQDYIASLDEPNYMSAAALGPWHDGPTVVRQAAFGPYWDERLGVSIESLENSPAFARVAAAITATMDEFLEAFPPDVSDKIDVRGLLFEPGAWGLHVDLRRSDRARTHGLFVNPLEPLYRFRGNLDQAVAGVVAVIIHEITHETYGGGEDENFAYAVGENTAIIGTARQRRAFTRLKDAYGTTSLIRRRTLAPELADLLQRYSSAPRPQGGSGQPGGGSRRYDRRPAGERGGQAGLPDNARQDPSRADAARTVTEGELRELARRTGTSVDVQRARAEAAGYRITDATAPTAQATVVPGLGQFVTRDAEPALRQAFANVDAAQSSIRALWAPARVSPPAETMEAVMRPNLALRRQRTARAPQQSVGVAIPTEHQGLGQRLRRHFGRTADARARTTMHDLAVAFQKVPRGEKTDAPDAGTQLGFAMAIDEGRIDELPAWQQGAARLLDDINTRKRQEVVALGGKMGYIEHYFPREWVQPGKVRAFVQRLIFGKRPLQGRAGFKKARSRDKVTGEIFSFRDLLDAGFEPVSYNPVDAHLRKWLEMDKWIAARRILLEGKRFGVAQFVPVGEQPPEGWVRYPESFGTVYGPPVIEIKEAYDAGLMEALHRFATQHGITIVRRVHLGGQRWGYHVRKADVSEIHTKFGGPEGVLMHEIGHALDAQYGLGEKIGLAQASERREEINFSEVPSKVARELRDLADLRTEARSSKHFKQYVRTRSEVIANLVHAFLYVPEKAKEVAPNAYWALYNLAKDTPDLRGLLDIQKARSLRFTTNTTTVPIGGRVIKGYYYGPVDAVRLMENHLSPGLRGNWLFNAYRHAGNLLNQVQLGLSGFHFVMTSLDQVVGKTGMALEHLSRGEVTEAAKKALIAPAAPLVDVIRGDRLLRQFYERDASFRTLTTVADAVARGGGGIGWDTFWHDSAPEKFVAALRATVAEAKAGNYPGAALRAASLPGRAALALIEVQAKPIMEWWVPRLKLAAYWDLYRMELADLGKVPDELELRKVAGRAWDTVDNWLGELIYDNLFWKNALKDAGMASVRALGWNLGSFRGPLLAPVKQLQQIGALPGAGSGGGFGKPPLRMRNVGFTIDPDTGLEVPTYARGRAPLLTHDFARLVALAFWAAFFGALYQYLHTGKKPGQQDDGTIDTEKVPIDLYFPQSGGVKPDGRPERVSIPGYHKDLWAVRAHPVETVLNKQHPLNVAVWEWLRNEDHFGTEVRNADDPWMQQLRDFFLFAEAQYVPISVRSYNQRKTERGEQQVGPIESFFGVTPAPGSVTRTPVEEYLRSVHPAVHRTQAQAERADQRRAVRTGLQTGDTAAVTAATKAGALSARGLSAVARASRYSSLQRSFMATSVEQALKAYELASPAERVGLRELLERKAANAFDETPADRLAPLLTRLQAARQLPMAARSPLQQTGTR